MWELSAVKSNACEHVKLTLAIPTRVCKHVKLALAIPTKVCEHVTIALACSHQCCGHVTIVLTHTCWTCHISTSWPCYSEWEYIPLTFAGPAKVSGHVRLVLAGLVAVSGCVM